MKLTSMCSSDPDTERRWRVRNLNTFGVNYTWTVVEDQHGQGTAEPGDSFFMTNTLPGANTVEITWVDAKGNEHSTVPASGGTACLS